MYIDQKEIEKDTENGKLIFEHYHRGYPFEKKNAYISIRHDDKTPSTNICFYKGLYRITDHGDPQVKSMSGIDYVMMKEGLEYKEALLFIKEAILNQKVNGHSKHLPNNKPEYEWREMKPEDKKGCYNFTFKEQASEDDLKSIGRYITPELLNKYCCKSVQQYEYCSYSKKLRKDVVHIYKATSSFPIFLFDYGSFKKLYKPYEADKSFRFMYTGDKPKDFVFGIKQIQNAKDEFFNESTGEFKPPAFKPDAVVKEIYRCSGESDALNLASLGYHVYWTNSETSGMNYNQWKAVDALCQYHYQVMDLDETGIKAATHFALEHINLMTIYLPDWLIQRKDWRGKRCKDLKDFISLKGNTQEETNKAFQVLKRKAMPMKFWTTTVAKKTDNVTYHLNLEYLYHFLSANGFYVMDSIYHRKAGYCYARVQGKVIDLIHPDDIKKVIKRFTKKWIRSNNLQDEIPILNKINSSAQIGEANLQELATIDPVLTNNSKAEEFLHFQNGSLRITKDSIEKIQHKELPNFILGSLTLNNERISHLVDRNIQLLSPPLLSIEPAGPYKELLKRHEMAKGEKEREVLNDEITNFDELNRYLLTIHDENYIFIRFLKDLANIHWRKELEQGIQLSDEEKKEQDLVFINLLFILGWNIAQYKDPGRPWLTFLQDMKISEVGKSTGRSGKSLLSLAIGHVRPSFYVAGRHKDITNKTDFIFDGYTIFHNNIEIDDLYEHADFNFFYTQVSGKREVNSKFISKQILDYPDSGKMLISSNFELQNTDSSTLARILNAGVSDYYHEKTKYNDYKETRTPAMKFGKSLYDDFTDDEWNKFYNLMAYCMQLSQRFHKIQPPMANLDKRQLRREMSKGVGKDEPFFLWANTYFEPAPENYINEFSPEHENVGYLNRYIIKEKVFNDFKETIPKSTASKYRSTQFKSSLKAFCEYHGYELNPKDKCGTNQANIESRRIVKTVHGSSKEVLYIQTKNTLAVSNPESTQKLENNDDNPF